MIKFKLEEVLEKQGKSMYWLAKESGIRPNTINQWANNDKLPDDKKVKSISIDTLNNICKTLQCNILDLIEYVEDDSVK